LGTVLDGAEGLYCFWVSKVTWIPSSRDVMLMVRNSLALVETKLILTHLFSNFDIKLRPESRDWFQGQTTHIAWEKPPLMVELAQR